MTEAQKRSVCELQDWLQKYGGDANGSNSSVSPRGDGRWVWLVEVWGRSNRATANRHNVFKAWQTGELRAYEIALVGDSVKLRPYEQIEEQEARFGGVDATARTT